MTPRTGLANRDARVFPAGTILPGAEEDIFHFVF
jgi:hypothetical protein